MNLDALHAWLAVEHEAVWLYGVIGGRRDDLSDAAREAWNRHRDTRDQLKAWITAAGGTASGPQLGYAAAPVDSDDAARTAAQAIEATVATAAANSLSGREHAKAIISAWRDAARAAADWGAPPSAFPGLD